MTSAEAQTILTTINTQINGRAGVIYGIHIQDDADGNPAAIVNIDWEAFKSTFSTQNADRLGQTWSKTIGAITYRSKSTDGFTTDVVPA